MEALDPNHERNSKEKVDSTIKAMQDRHVVYDERINEAIQVLADLQRRIRDRTSASRRAEQQPAPASTPHEGPRFVPREGAPGKLADSVDPGGLSKWLAVFQDWMLASYGGAPTTDAQMLTQVKLMLEPGWRKRMDNFAYSGGSWQKLHQSP